MLLKATSLSGFIAHILFASFIYGFAYQAISPVNLAGENTIFMSLVGNLIFGLAAALFLQLFFLMPIAILVARVSRKNRKKPLRQYIYATTFPLWILFIVIIMWRFYVVEIYPLEGESVPLKTTPRTTSTVHFATNELDGLTLPYMNHAYLLMSQAVFEDSIIKYLAQNNANGKAKKNHLSLVVDGVYEGFHGNKLLRLEANWKNEAKEHHTIIQFRGITNDKLESVTCSNMTHGLEQVSSEKCDAALLAVFTNHQSRTNRNN